MKKFFIVLGIIVFLLAGIAIAKDQIIKSIVVVAASRVTGFPVQIDGFSFSILNSTIRISGLRMYNPKGFPEGILVSCPKINVTYDRAALFSRKIHLLNAEIALEEMGLTKNKEGKLNVDSLKGAGAQQSKPSEPMPMQIDLLTLSIGKIVSKDYTAGDQPSVRVHDINIHKSYKNITSAQQLALLVLAEPVKAAGIKSAQIYGVAMLAGAAVLPVGVAATFIGKDNVQQIVDASLERVYSKSLEAVKGMGTVTKQDAENGVIKANIKGAMVALKFRKTTDNKTEVTISARKYMVPMPDIAGGVLYQILENIRKP